MIIRKAAAIFIVLVVSCSLSVSLAQQAGKEKKIIKSTREEIEGSVTDIKKGFITIVYQHDETKGVEYEMLVPVDGTVEMQHRKSIKELNVGDTVSVIYDDVVFEDEFKVKTTKRNIRIVKFVRPAEKKPEQLRLPEPGEGLPDDIVVGK